MSCHVLLEFDLKPDAIDTFKALLVKHLPDARTFAGNEYAQVIENQGTPGNIVIIEIWQTRQHFEKYLAWRAETGVLGLLAACCVSEPGVRFYETVNA